ncbi:hypothetical protein D3C85_1891890 [compost metagenome]
MIRKTTNKILAMPTAVETMPKNPKTPATTAMIRNRIAQPNISNTSLFLFDRVHLAMLSITLLTSK